MNFVGHAMVARWERDHAAYAFGAMLPDFERMCGTRLTHAGDATVAAGIECHHRVDAAFHDAPTFLALCQQAREDLRARGLPRPTVLAAAHVGVELLLDGCFVQQPQVLDHFVAAVVVGAAAAPTLRWGAEDGAARFSVLCERVGRPSAALGYADPDAVAERLVAILSRRPRLRPPPHAHASMHAWAIAMRPAVAAAAPQVLHELRTRLA